MTRENKYIISIIFEKGNNFVSRQIKSTYIGSGTFQDDIEITPERIIITAHRSSKINTDDIFYNYSSSLYIQIMKSLIFYYLNSESSVTIQNISVKRYRNNKLLNSQEITSSNLTQVASSSFKILKNNLDVTKLCKLFDNDEKGEAILIASSYIAKANSITDEIEKFERLWKAFNRLYKFIGKNQNELNCHLALKDFIFKNTDKFPLVIQKVKRFSASEIRTNLRWRALILNDYEKPNQTKAFYDFILRYTDKRVMELLQELLIYRKDNLVKEKLYNRALNHIQSHIAQNCIKDEEIVTLLCVKYMYFVRNKLMHGEKLDSTFRLLPNKEIKELRWLNGILELLVIDLINCNDSY